MPMTRSQLRSKSSAKDSNVPSEGFPLPDSPNQVGGKEINNTPDPRIKPEATEETGVLETLNPETDHDQADRFQLPEWITSHLNFDAEFKELCLNIQKTARMEARATEIRARLNQPEAQIIVNLIEELNGLEDDPLREELDSAMEKLYAANRKFNFATKLMQDFGLSAAPQTVSQVLLQKTRTASPSTMPVSSPATGALGCESSVEHPAAGPAMAPTTGVAAYLQASSPSAQAACSSGNRVEKVHGDEGSMARTKPSAASLKIVKKLAKAQKGRKVPSAKSSGKVAKISIPPLRQSHLADFNEQPQAMLHQGNGDELAVSDGGDAQLDSQADKMSDKVQGFQSEPNEEGDDEEGISQGNSDEEKPREPVYYKEPGESSYDAQSRYIKAFQEYTKKSIIYQKRSKDRAARKREHESEQPSEDLAKRSRLA